MGIQLETRSRNNPSNDSVAKSSKKSSFDWGTLFNSISDKEKVKFYSSLSVLLNAGMDINQSINLLEDQNTSKKWSKIYAQIIENLLKGDHFYIALGKTKLFSEYELTNLQIGEETGFLPQFIQQLEAFYENKIKLKRLIVNTFSYPVIVLIITLGTLYFMLKYIVPMFASIFSRFNKELPEMTQAIIELSNFVSSNGIYFILLVSIITIAHVMLMKMDQYKLLFGNFVYKIPLVGDTVLKIQIARFSMAMFYLIKSGTPLIRSLELTTKMIGFYPLNLALTEATEKVMNGTSMNDAFKVIKMIPSTFTALVKVGEEVNQLDLIFEKLSIQYQKELEYQTQVIGKVLEPLLIMVVAIIVGVILIAMYLPLFNLGNVM